MTTNEKESQLCRFYVLRGSCHFGESCKFSHSMPQCGAAEACKMVPCPYFQQGNCRYGDNCKLRHDEGDRKHYLSSNHECGICLEDVKATGNSFGLLSCDHCFCLTCVWKWRKTNSCEKEVTRACPTCRKVSDFVVPSKFFCVGEEKERVIANYKNNLSKIPCKLFNGTIGSCPFGPKCFYAHKGPDGEDLKPMDVAKRRNQRRRRTNYSRNEFNEFNAFMSLLVSLSSYNGFDSDSDDDDYIDSDNLIFLESLEEMGPFAT